MENSRERPTKWKQDKKYHKRLVICASIVVLTGFAMFLAFEPHFLAHRVLFSIGSKRVQDWCIQDVEEQTDVYYVIYGPNHVLELTENEEPCRADDAVEFVRIALRSDDPAVRFWAVQVLARTSDRTRKSVVEILKQTISDSDFKVKAYSINLLGSYGNDASCALSTLRCARQFEMNEELCGHLDDAIACILGKDQ